jgi:hypothetical protein
MLTRAQVAKRLGKSIATVRRMEGTALHPWRDEAGVHRFHPSEVDDVRQTPSETAVLRSRSEWFEEIVVGVEKGFLDEFAYSSKPSTEPPSANEHALRERLAAAERQLAATDLELERADEREQALVRRISRLREAATDEVCAFLDTLSPQQVKQIGSQRIRLLLSSLRAIHSGAM